MKNKLAGNDMSVISDRIREGDELMQRLFADYTLYQSAFWLAYGVFRHFGMPDEVTDKWRRQMQKLADYVGYDGETWTWTWVLINDERHEFDGTFASTTMDALHSIAGTNKVEFELWERRGKEDLQITLDPVGLYDGMSIVTRAKASSG